MYLLTLSRANGTNKTEYVLPTIVCSCCHVLKRPQAGEIIGSSIVRNQPLVNISWYISYTWWFHLYVDQHGYSKQTIGSGQVGAEGLSGLSSPPCEWSVLLHVLPTLPQSTLFFATTILRKKQQQKTAVQTLDCEELRGWNIKPCWFIQQAVLSLWPAPLWGFQFSWIKIYLFTNLWFPPTNTFIASKSKCFCFGLVKSVSLFVDLL